MAIVPEAIGQGRWPLSFSKLSDKATSARVSNTVGAAVFTTGLMLVDTLPVFAALTLFFAISVFSVVALADASILAFFFASRIASSLARRMAAAIALASF